MVQGPGIKSYWLGSVDDRIVSFKDLLMTTASTIFEKCGCYRDWSQILIKHSHRNVRNDTELPSTKTSAF